MCFRSCFSAFPFSPRRSSDYDAAKEASDAASRKYSNVKHQRESLLTEAFAAVSSELWGAKL